MEEGGDSDAFMANPRVSQNSGLSPLMVDLLSSFQCYLMIY